MIVLLPGMDGTGELFLPFLNSVPKSCAVHVVRYPTNIPLTYPELEQYVLNHLPSGEPITLVAESFSGPIALRLSVNTTINLRTVVVVCSFASRPFGLLGSILARLIVPLPFKLRVHPILLRTFLFGNDASDELITATVNAISSVHPNVLAGRLRDALMSQYCSRLAVPASRVIALFSRRDRLLGHRGHSSIIETCPKAEAYILDAPHFALQTTPDQIVRKLRELGVLDEPPRS